MTKKPITFMQMTVTEVSTFAGIKGTKNIKYELNIGNITIKCCRFDNPVGPIPLATKWAASLTIIARTTERPAFSDADMTYVTGYETYGKTAKEAMAKLEFLFKQLISQVMAISLNALRLG